MAQGHRQFLILAALVLKVKRLELGDFNGRRRRLKLVALHALQGAKLLARVEGLRTTRGMLSSLHFGFQMLLVDQLGPQALQLVLIDLESLPECGKLSQSLGDEKISASI